MPKPQGLLERLTAQLSDNGAPEPEKMARFILVARGHMLANGQLTEEGRRREAMGAEGRAKDRAAREYGCNPGECVYDPATNRARRAKP